MLGLILLGFNFNFCIKIFFLKLWKHDIETFNKLWNSLPLDEVIALGFEKRKEIHEKSGLSTAISHDDRIKW